MATQPSGLLQILARLGLGAGQGLASALQQQGNPQAYAQQQENARLQQQQQQQRYEWEQGMAMRQSDAAQAQKNWEQTQVQQRLNLQATQDARTQQEREWLLSNQDKVAPAQSTDPGALQIAGGWYTPRHPNGPEDLIDLSGPFKELGITRVGGGTGPLSLPAEKALPFIDLIQRGKEARKTLDSARATYNSMISDNEIAKDNPLLAKVFEGRIASAESPADLRQVGEDITKHVQATIGNKAKDRYTTGISKLMAEGVLQAGDVADLGKIGKAINSSKTLNADEKSFLSAYPAANTTPATSQQQQIVRMDALGGTRQFPVLDTKTNQLITANSNDLNAMREQEPGRYVIANAQGIGTMQKSGQFRALHYSINNAKAVIKDLPDLDAGTRLQLANAMGQDNPGVLHEMFQGSIASAGTEKQKNAIRAIQLLAEDAMSLRNVQGIGAGSDMVRKAVHDLLPSGKSADKKDMQARIDQFEALVSNLETGVPQLGTGQRQPAAPTGATGGRPPLQFNFTGLPQEAR